MRKWYLLIFILHWTLVGVAQEKLTLNGYIKDGLSGETLLRGLGLKAAEWINPW